MSTLNRCMMTAACGLLVAAGAAVAQSTFGSITGVVLDTSGGVIPDSQVSVTNMGTGAKRDTKTGSTGVFNVANLDVGTYRLRVSAEGFTTYERSDLHLAANQVLNLNVELALGSTTSVVEVQAASPIISTETNDLGSSMGKRSVQTLPLVSRHAGDAGVSTYFVFNTGTAAVPSSSGVIVQGARASGAIPTRDGIRIGAYQQGTGPVQPSLESVEAVTLVRAIAPAEFATAANLGVITRAGTNEFHGRTFYDYNTSSWNSRSFFANTVPFRVYHDFGASASGPIVKNKLFFMASYEGSRERAKKVTIEDVPLEPWHKGDFSGLLARGTVVKDPLTGQPFSGNQVPANRISSVSQKVQEYFFPFPNTGAPGALSSNWQIQLPGTTGFTRYDHFDARVDYRLTNRDAIFGRVSWRRLPLEYVDLYPLHVTQLRRGESAAFSWSRTLSPAAINEFRFGATYHVNPYWADVIGSDLLQQFGIKGISTAGIHDAPIFQITGVTSIDLDAVDDSYQNNPASGFEWIDNVSWTRGRHFMKLGIDVNRERINGNKISSNIYGAYSFSGAYTGLGYADFLLGIPQTTTLGLVNPERDHRGTSWAFYAQDQFKVNKSLTLNYGVRWELAGPYRSKRGTLYSFDPASGKLVVADDGLDDVNPLYPKNIPIITASQAGYPAETLVDLLKTNIQPRVGFAYKILGGTKAVIRGGYGIYGNVIYGELVRNQMIGGPFSGSVTYTNQITGGVPLFSFPSPFGAAGTTSVQNVNGVNPHVKNPYTQQWNLTFEQELASVGFRVSYLGSRSVSLLYRRNLNQPPPSTAPFSNNLRRYPLYNRVVFAESGGMALYNALEVGAEKRFGRNLTFNTGWTWAKDLTDAQDSGGGGSTFAGQVIENQFDRSVEKANNQLVIPHRVFAYAVYTLPLGSGQRFLSGAKGILQQLAGGWETAWTAVAQSGQWFTPSFGGSDPSNTNTIGGRPDRVANGNLPSGRTNQRWFDTAAFAVPGCPATDPLCARTPRVNVGRFGNSGLNVISGPPIRNLDFALMKNFSLRETTRLQFRLTMANALNHPNFAVPRSNISATSTVGTINSQVRALNGSPSTREVDIGLRLEF